jgi:pimeloyl-ACP methyl ester carboxylesterase
VTLFQRIHYIWVRGGLALLVLMPLAAYVTFRPWGVAADVLQTHGGVTVTDRDEAIVFVPAAPRSSGLLLLPGCPVDPVAYTPLGRRIAEQGHLAMIVKIPYRCASSSNLAAQLDRRVRALAATSPTTRWVLAGHSRGAAHAARIANANPNHLVAYVLIGTSHPRDHDLSQLAIDVTKVAATKDNVAGPAQFETARLPASTRWVRIEGGNHAQFGHYGYQLFDGRATITRDAQQAATLAALLAVLSRH